MKKIIIYFCFIIFNVNANLNAPDEFEKIKSHQADWLVVGAGPAGIVSVSVLLDLGILPKRIYWIDPVFNVGLLSSYETVSANNKSKFFVKFLENCKTFQECVPNEIENLKKLDQEKEYNLEEIVGPLSAITSILKNKVNSIQGKMSSLYFEDDLWKVGVNNTVISAMNVILATGSHPRKLCYDEFHEKEISLEDALNFNYLKNNVTENDIFGVIGGSHSAILILKYLSELKVKKVYNFYQTPIKYVVDMGSWKLNNECGIKGITADWAKNVLEKNPPANLERILSNQANLKKLLPICTKLVYALGFERNEIPAPKENPTLKYNETNGVIGPRLFGIGIAFPEKTVDPLGNVEHKVGLNSFIEYAQKVVPNWIKKNDKLGYKKRKKLLSLFAGLVDIEVL